MGTGRRVARSATPGCPALNAPDRLLVPSGAMPMIIFRSSARTAAVSAPRSTWPRATGIMSQSSMKNLVYQCFHSSRLPSAVAGRGWMKT